MGKVDDGGTRPRRLSRQRRALSWSPPSTPAASAVGTAYNFIVADAASDEHQSLSCGQSRSICTASKIVIGRGQTGRIHKGYHTCAWVNVTNGG